MHSAETNYSRAILMVLNDTETARKWMGALRANGHRLIRSYTEDHAVQALDVHKFNLIIMDIVFNGGASLAIANLAAYRTPHAKIIFVTNSMFFADGSLLRLIPNACAYIKSSATAEELTILAEHHMKCLT